MCTRPTLDVHICHNPRDCISAKARLGPHAACALGPADAHPVAVVGFGPGIVATAKPSGERTVLPTSPSTSQTSAV